MALVDTQTLSHGFKGFANLPAVRQVGLLMALAASVSIGVGIALWSREPAFQLLYSGGSQADGMEVMQSLERMNIKYMLDAGSGSISVDKSEVYRARVELAKIGLPRGSGTQGFELLEGEQAFGMSRMLETARHNHALEGELARTISALNTVRSARVHIARPKSTVFVRELQKPSASVILDLRSGTMLGDEDIAGIVHLVAASVPQLEPESVTVVDQRGRLLTKRGGPEEFNGSSDRLKYSRAVESGYVQRIEAILSPVVGDGGVRAQVTAKLDFTSSEQAVEDFDPTDVAVRSEQVNEESSELTDPQGIPGALSNQPPPAGSTAEQAVRGRQFQGNSQKSSVRNFELDRTLRHSKTIPGEVLRLSVAVVVDNKTAVNTNGVKTRTQWTAEEMTRLTNLVKQAVGFDQERGDAVTVSNEAFFVAEEFVVEASPFWTQPWIWTMAKEIVGPIFIIILLFSILRPVLRSLASANVARVNTDHQPLIGGPPGLPAGMTPAALADMSVEDRASFEREQLGNEHERLLEQAEMEEANYDQTVDHIRNVVEENPGRAAQVVKEWIKEDG